MCHAQPNACQQRFHATVLYLALKLHAHLRSNKFSFVLTAVSRNDWLLGLTHLTSTLLTVLRFSHRVAVICT